MRKLHAWCGLVLCLLLVPMALSGAGLVFKPQWLRATVPGADAAVVVTPDEAARAMRAAEAQFPAATSVIFAGPAIGVHEVLGPDGGGYVAAGSGARVQAWGKNERVVDWLFDLHHHLLAGDTGTTVAGTAGFLAVLMILTGVILWLPAWRSFGWQFWPMRNRRAGWIGAHRDLGIVAAPVAALVALTGSGVALDAVYARAMGFERMKPPAAAGIGEMDWAAAFAAAQARFPGAEIRIAAFPKPGKPALIRVRQPAEWHANGRTSLWLDPATSRILKVDDALAQAPAQQVYNTFWPLHASKVGGLPLEGGHLPGRAIPGGAVALRG
ncbi:PepSY domain-containing protein [Phenylobacterium sp. J367]|uniref:PepSY-associated TM helix domain-containing protein n=1 Tax=Phenylobacterium sp. J367 TaxID=2898435 RepID=UPI002151AA96|nr:PepSY-associated TM helix domain-containing protein [Phenylobacterium sp. J367]MCR5879965.1 PepSY domain-containing protein [Phenylobacterium sp. J367]